MPSKTPRAAFTAFIDPFRRAVGCVTDSHVTHTGYQPTPFPLSMPVPEPHRLALVPRGGTTGDLTPLRTRYGRRGVLLSVVVQYRVVRLEPSPIEGSDCTVLVSYYAYELLTEAEEELLVFHWHPEDPLHPEGVSEITFPHLHLPESLPPIELGRAYDRVDMRPMHIPTGMIFIEDVVELLIREFGIAPRRPDWPAVLRDNRRQRLDN